MKVFIVDEYGIVKMFQCGHRNIIEAAVPVQNVIELPFKERVSGKNLLQGIEYFRQRHRFREYETGTGVLDTSRCRYSVHCQKAIR